MIDQSKNVDAKAEEVSVPGMIEGLRNATQNQLSQYRVRIDRFVIEANLDDCSRLENLYTRSLEGKDVVILKEKSFTDKEQMIVVVFYMEKRIPEGFDQPTTAS